MDLTTVGIVLLLGTLAIAMGFLFYGIYTNEKSRNEK